MTGNILIRCPAMAVLSTWRCWIRECQQLVCPDNEIVLEDGTKIEFTLIIPKVLVRWKSWGKWLVDEVTAEGVTQYGGRISLTLEKERVSRTTWRTMNAEPCNAIGTAEVGGLRWKIGPHISQTGVKSFFPKCQVVATGLGIFQYIAEPVTAEGTLMSN